MGCTSSTHFKKQAIADGWNPSPSKRYPRSTTFSSADFDRHLVALTSSSYGLIKVDSPKPAEEVKKKNTGGLESLNEMYEKLKGLELADSAPKSWNEVNSMLQTVKPGLENSNLSPAWGLAIPQGLENVEVGDIMKGLDEGTPRSASNPKAATSAGKPLSTTAPVPRKHRKFDKAMPFHTLEELDARLGERKPGEVLNDPPEIATKGSPALARHGSAEEDVSEKENAKPPGSENGHLTVPSKTARKDSSQDVLNKSGRGISPTSIMKYAASSGKINLNLNPDRSNNLSSTHTESIPAGSLTKRALVSIPGLSTEPSCPLFDPDLLASYEKVLENLSQDDWDALHVNDEQNQKTLDGESTDANKEVGPSDGQEPLDQAFEREPTDEASQRQSNEASNLSSKTLPITIQKKLYDPFQSFEEKCPPGGDKTVVLYTTTLRGIRKTFEDCNKVRGILQRFGLSIDERDVSMHLEFRNELRELMDKVVSVPRMFIKGRYIGGVEEIAKLCESGKLSELVEGLPAETNGGNCDGCGGARFVPCLDCSGSCKIVDEDNNLKRCPECNENGLIHCPICS